MGTVVINEIFYNPADGDDADAEFVELHNPGDTAVDLTGFMFDDEGSAAKGETVTLSGPSRLVRSRSSHLRDTTQLLDGGSCRGRRWCSACRVAATS